MTEEDREFHNSFKPTWGPGNALLYSLPEPVEKRRRSSQKSQSLRVDNMAFAGRNVRIAKLAKAVDVSLA